MREQLPPVTWSFSCIPVSMCVGEFMRVSCVWYLEQFSPSTRGPSLAFPAMREVYGFDAPEKGSRQTTLASLIYLMAKIYLSRQLDSDSR